MPRSQAIEESLTKLLDESSQPIYVVDDQRRIVYSNAALAEWIDLERKRIIGRRVEYHSEEPAAELARKDAGPLTDLCPPPSVLSGTATTGTISCQARDGHIKHRAAEFIPLGQPLKPKKSHDPQAPTQCAVLVLLAANDLLPQEVAAQVSGEPTADELHRTIRRFRAGQAKRYSLQSVLGSSAAMQKVRAQIEAAAASGANVLIYGPNGNGQSHVARAIHYRSTNADETTLIPLDCEVVTDELFADTLARFRPAKSAAAARPTLLLENLEYLSASHQEALKDALRPNSFNARIIATMGPAKSLDEAASTSKSQPSEVTFEELATTSPDSQPSQPTGFDPTLLQAISTISIRIPPLAERLGDLPVLAQYFLEACNRINSKQVGSLRSQALDSLALYSWPGELDQLRETIEAAHAACTSHEISSADLPPTFFHAFKAAAHVRRRPEPIDLDTLLSSIEKEAITRALALAGGNKSEAATLLGMTRPRLYRRLVQLGLASEEPGTEAPEFIESDANE